MEPQADPQPPIPPQQSMPPPNMSQPQDMYSATPPTPLQQQPTSPIQTGMFNGRLNRLGYFMGIVYVFVYFLVLVILQLLFRHSGAKTVFNIISILGGMAGVLLVIPVGISLGVRRWHDLNQSGLLVLLNLIPFVGLITLIIQLFFPGTKGPNKYGDPDLSSASLKKVLFGR